jgi:hypothetical protein
MTFIMSQTLKPEVSKSEGDADRKQKGAHNAITVF